LTIGFSEELTPTANFSFFFYHGVFYFFWFVFMCLLASNLLKTPQNSYVSAEVSLMKIFDKNLKNLIILHPLRKNPITKNILTTLFAQTDHKTTKILINSSEEIYNDIEFPNFFFYQFDLFEEKMPFLNEINEIDQIKYYLFTNNSLKNEETNDYKAILSCSIVRHHIPKAFISTQLRKEEHLFLEWADWDFAMSSDNLRVMIKINFFR